MSRLLNILFLFTLVGSVKIHSARNIDQSRHVEVEPIEMTNVIYDETNVDDMAPISKPLKSPVSKKKKKLKRRTANFSLRQHLIDVLFGGNVMMICWILLFTCLYEGSDPFDYMEDREWLDDDYPFTNLSRNLVMLVLHIQEMLQQRPVEFYLELGTMFGGSLEIAHMANPNITLLAIDTFLGDVNTWVWESQDRRPDNLMDFEFLDLHGGQPRVYERFLFNVKKRGFHHRVVPFRTTTIVGMKVLQRLYVEGHLLKRPEVIYLDSAHEEVETLLELQEAWCLLPEAGVLFGDDWRWDTVRKDVLKFSHKLKKSPEAVRLAEKISPGDSDVDIEWFDKRIVVFDEQTWMLIKLPSDKSCINAFA